MIYTPHGVKGAILTNLILHLRWWSSLFIPNYTDYGLTACLRLGPSSLTAGPDSRFLLLHGVIGLTLHVLDCILGFRGFGNPLSGFASYFTGVLIFDFFIWFPKIHTAFGWVT